MNTVPIPSGEPAGRIVCPRCGNVKNFVEVADHVLMTTHFIQNRDGSFTRVDREIENIGELRLYCGHCSADVSQFHSHLHEMIF